MSLRHVDPWTQATTPREDRLSRPAIIAREFQVPAVRAARVGVTQR